MDKSNNRFYFLWTLWAQDEDGDKVSCQTTLFTHIFCAALAGVAVPTTYVGHANQCSH
jgi:hypothetical protein